MDRFSKQNINKYIVALNNALDEMDYTYKNSRNNNKDNPEQVEGQK